MAKPQFDITKAMAELETISAWFDEADIDLEKGLAKMKRAKELIDQIQQRLKKTENEFVALKKALEIRAFSVFHAEQTTLGRPK